MQIDVRRGGAMLVRLRNDQYYCYYIDIIDRPPAISCPFAERQAPF